MTAKYGRASRARRQEVAALPIARTITADTKLVSVETASQLLKDERGLELSVRSIRQRCATGQWTQGMFWVKPCKQYLINVQAIYEAIARGERI